jgi:hypothetical protein
MGYGTVTKLVQVDLIEGTVALPTVSCIYKSEYMVFNRIHAT